jgi:hypothetical protein
MVLPLASGNWQVAVTELTLPSLKPELERLVREDFRLSCVTGILAFDVTFNGWTDYTLDGLIAHLNESVLGSILHVKKTKDCRLTFRKKQERREESLRLSISPKLSRLIGLKSTKTESTNGFNILEIPITLSEYTLEHSFTWDRFFPSNILIETDLVIPSVVGSHLRQVLQLVHVVGAEWYMNWRPIHLTFHYPDFVSTVARDVRYINFRLIDCDERFGRLIPFSSSTSTTTMTKKQISCYFSSS